MAQRYATEDAAVLAAFDCIYPYAQIMNWEFGGIVCFGNGTYRLPRLVTQRQQAPMFNYLRVRQPDVPMNGIPPVPTNTLRFRKLLPDAPEPWSNTCVLQGAGWVPYSLSPTTICR